MPNSDDRKCPDCASPMQPIMIIDRSRLNEIQSIDSVLSYTSPDARPSFWTGKIPATGAVSSYACTQCGRILLYAKKAQ